MYDGQRHISPASLPGIADRTITISGFSKVFSITGWRVGFLHASARWIPAISYFHDLTYVCAPSPFQHGAAAGLEQLPDSFYAELIQEYQRKREMICDALRVAGLEPSVPAGAYYVLADASVVPGRRQRREGHEPVAAHRSGQRSGRRVLSRWTRRSSAALLFCQDGCRPGGRLRTSGADCVTAPAVSRSLTPLFGNDTAALLQCFDRR